MKLNKQDIRLLIDDGVSAEDIIDMIMWGEDVKCYIDTTNKKHERVSYNYATKYLGRINFLRGIHRAMYHMTTSREHISFVNTIWR